MMNRTSYLVTIIFFMVLAFLSYRLVPFAFDDAYIHFRIAENLARHGQPYFNLGERIMSTSSPVWTCVLAALYGLGVALPLTVAFLNSILTIAGATVWMRCLTLLNAKASRWLVLFFAVGYIGVMIPSCVGLMETPLAMLLMATAVLLLFQDRATGWVCVALAIFTRVELVVFVPFFAIAVLLIKHSSVYRHAAFFASAVGLLAVLTWISYGTLVPQPFVAKQIVYDISRDYVFVKVFDSMLPRLGYPFLSFLPPGWTIQNLLASLLAWVLVPGVCLPLGATLISLPWRSMLHDRNHIWTLSVGAGGVSITLTYVLKHVFLHDWYVPLFAIPILFFFFAVATSKRIMHYISVSVLLVVPFSILLQYSLGAFYTEYLPTKARGARVQRYIEVGALLRHLFPDAKLMTSEIGGLGYSFKGHILDGVGLITPDALKYHPLEVGLQRTLGIIGAIPAAYVNEEKPELIVSYPVFIQEFESSPYADLYRKISVPAFSKKYREQTKENGIWGCDVLNIYIRKDIADPKKSEVLTNELRATSG